MGNKTSVVFKGVKNGIIMDIKENYDFNFILNEFKEKLIHSKSFFNNTRLNIKFTGRSLSELEYSQLIDIINNESTIDISYVEYQTDNEIKIHNKDSMTVHKGTVRSGQKIESEGDIVILGDINPGGLVHAKGNIIVFGNLLGSVYSYNNKKENLFVVAINMNPMQIRINNIIARGPDRQSETFKLKHKQPEIAFVVNENIHIEPIDNKSLSKLIISN